MAIEEKVKKALKKGARKLHTHEVSYKRADNGGIHAKVERHTKEGHHHTENHVLANFDDAQQHFQEHMGDQPQAGGQPPMAEAPPPQMAGADAGAGGGAPGAMPPPQPGM
jgi:hypothetical protein